MPNARSSANMEPPFGASAAPEELVVPIDRMRVDGVAVSTMLFQRAEDAALDAPTDVSQNGHVEQQSDVEQTDEVAELPVARHSATSPLGRLATWSANAAKNLVVWHVDTMFFRGIPHDAPLVADTPAKVAAPDGLIPVLTPDLQTAPVPRTFLRRRAPAEAEPRASFAARASQYLAESRTRNTNGRAALLDSIQRGLQSRLSGLHLADVRQRRTAASDLPAEQTTASHSPEPVSDFATPEPQSRAARWLHSLVVSHLASHFSGNLRDGVLAAALAEGVVLPSHARPAVSDSATDEAQPPDLEPIAAEPAAKPESRQFTGPVEDLFATDADYARALADYPELVRQFRHFIELRDRVAQTYGRIHTALDDEYVVSTRGASPRQIEVLTRVYRQAEDQWNERWERDTAPVNTAIFLTENELLRKGIAMTGVPEDANLDLGISEDEWAKQISRAYVVGYALTDRGFFRDSDVTEPATTEQREAPPAPMNGTVHELVVSLREATGYYHRLERDTLADYDRRTFGVNQRYAQAASRQAAALQIQLNSIYVAEPLNTQAEYDAALAAIRDRMNAAYRQTIAGLALASMQEQYRIDEAHTARLAQIRGERAERLNRVHTALILRHERDSQLDDAEYERTHTAGYEAPTPTPAPAQPESIYWNTPEYWANVDQYRAEGNDLLERLEADQAWLERYFISQLEVVRTQYDDETIENDTLDGYRARLGRAGAVVRLIEAYEATQFQAESDDIYISTVSHSPDEIERLALQATEKQMNSPAAKRARRLADRAAMEVADKAWRDAIQASRAQERAKRAAAREARRARLRGGLLGIDLEGAVRDGLNQL